MILPDKVTSFLNIASSIHQCLINEYKISHVQVRFKNIHTNINNIFTTICGSATTEPLAVA